MLKNEKIFWYKFKQKILFQLISKKFCFKNFNPIKKYNFYQLLLIPITNDQARNMFQKLGLSET